MESKRIKLFFVAEFPSCIEMLLFLFVGMISAIQVWQSNLFTLVPLWLAFLFANQIFDDSYGLAFYPLELQ